MHGSLLVVTLASAATFAGPFAVSATAHFGTCQVRVARANTIPTIRGPTVIAVVHGPLDSVAKALDGVRAMASAFNYQFVIAPETIPAYVRAHEPGSGLWFETAVYVPADHLSGYALVSPSRTPEFVRGLAPTGQLRKALRDLRRPPLLALYLDFWPVAVASAVVVAASLTSAIRRKAIWIPLSLAAAGCSLAFVAPVIAAHAANPFRNMLQRDVVAALVLAAGVPLLVSLVAFLMSGRGVALLYRVIVPCVIAVVCIGTSPLYLLFVHCTSGDCI